LHQLFFIPYEISNDGVVENELAYINENSEEYIFQKSGRDSIEIPLEKGDRIIAVDGIPVENSLQLLSALQQRHIRIIVERGENRIPVSWKKADGLFDANVHFADLDTLVHSLGSGSTETTAGNLHLLAPVVPKFLNDFPMTEAEKQERESKISSWKKEIEGIKDAKEKAEAIRFLEEDQKRLVLGIALQDKEVIYNPSPFALFGDVLEQTWRTLASLFSGHLSPKFLSGPVGIIQVMQYGWTMGIKEALFWMAVISLNLGIINLFPLPVLDGGHICFSVIESITKKPIKAKTMERLIIPFIVLMILFFIYLTYNDLLRVFGRFF
jgi:regulator of sigma E protease